MSRIDDLVREHCPDGVPYQTLGEVGDFVRGNGIQKSDLIDRGVPAIHYGQVHTTYGTWADETVSFVAPALAAKLRKAKSGDLVIATTSEDDQAVGKATAWVGAEEAAISGDAYIYRHSLVPKYVAYFFQTDDFQNQKTRWITGTKVRRLSGASLANIRIPVPHPDVQQEIVRVLDSMKNLEAELQAELEVRRLQYTRYRDSLMTFRGAQGVEWIPLRDLATVARGASPRPIQAFLTDADDGVPWIKIGDVPADGKYITKTAQRVTKEGAAKSRLLKPGDFVLSNSMSFGRPYISSIDGAIHDGWLTISDFGGSFVPDFLYHLLRSTPIQAEFARRAGSSTVSNLNAEIVRAVSIPVPMRGEQERIGAILDAFEALVNDPSAGIPAEIKARRRQYEYYRNKLLTFEEAVA